jgi:hypothetical protein
LVLITQPESAGKAQAAAVSVKINTARPIFLIDIFSTLLSANYLLKLQAMQRYLKFSKNKKVQAIHYTFLFYFLKLKQSSNL